MSLFDRYETLKHCTKTSSKEAILQAGSVNSMGVFIDDPQSIASLRDVFVDFYSGCTKSTIARGKEAVHSALFVTSNEVVNGTARYIGKHLETEFFSHTNYSHRQAEYYENN